MWQACLGRSPRNAVTFVTLLQAIDVAWAQFGIDVAERHNTFTTQFCDLTRRRGSARPFLVEFDILASPGCFFSQEARSSWKESAHAISNDACGGALAHWSIHRDDDERDSAHDERSVTMDTLINTKACEEDHLMSCTEGLRKTGFMSQIGGSA